MLIIAVTFAVHDQHIDAFRAAVVENAKTSVRDENGCSTFDVCESKECGVFFLYEKYDDDAAFDHHLTTRHFKEFDQLVSNWVKAKKVERYHLL